MAIQNISVQQLHDWMNNNQATLIDVREPAEHASGAIKGASLKPLGSITANDLPNGTSKHLVLHCQKGGRSMKACQKLVAKKPELELYNLEGGFSAWEQAGLPTTNSGKRILPLDRQVQLTVGIILLIASALTYTMHINFVAVAAFMGAGLTFAGLTGTCGLAKLLAAIPWNRS